MFNVECSVRCRLASAGGRLAPELIDMHAVNRQTLPADPDDAADEASRPGMIEAVALQPLRLLQILACTVIIVAGMRAASAIVVPFLLAAFLTIVFAPLLVWLRQRGVRTGLAVVVVVLLLLAVFIVVAFLVGGSVETFAARLPAYQRGLKSQLMGLIDAAHQRGWDVPEEILTDYVNPEVAMRMIGNTVTGMAGVLTHVVVIFLAVIFMLAEVAILPAKLRRVLRRPDDSMERLSQFVESFNRYLAIKTLVSLLTGISAGIWVWLLGVDFPVLWGLLAFVLNYVPNLGSLMAAVPPVLLAMVQYGPSRFLGMAGGYVAINFLFGNLLEPRLMGRGLGLSTLVIFVSMVVWGWVLGPVGMLLSAPLTMVCRIALESHRETQGLAILLGSGRT